MNVVLIGEESAGIQTLAVLKQSSHFVVAVLASPNNICSSGASVWNAARNQGMETWPAQRVRDPQLAEKLRAEKVDIILNVHSLYVIHSSVLAAPSIGAFNLHPGPLPRYAGLNPISWAIYRGETTHGVTVHKMIPEIDAGPIVYQARFPVEDGDSALALSRKCVKEGLILIQRLLEVAAIDPSQIPLTPQDLQERQYFGKEVPETGRLSWSWPAAEVVNFVRSCDYFPFRSPWGHPLTDLGGTRIAIVKAGRTGIPCRAAPGTVGEALSSGVLVACGDEWALVKKLKVGKDYVNPATLLCSGQRFGPNTSLGQPLLMSRVGPACT